MTEQWKEYLRHVCRSGHIYHSREMFDLFLALIDDGTLDGVRPGFAVNDDWWSVLYSVARDRPDLASEAIGHWLGRTVTVWRESTDVGSAKSSLSSHIDRSGNGERVIEMSGKDPLSYAVHLLDKVARSVDETAKERRDHLHADELWSHRWFGDRTYQVHSTVLSVLAKSLERIAVSAPVALDHLLEPYLDRPHDTVAYLVLRAYTAAPAVFADAIVDYLSADPRRLKVGYSAWGAGGGSAENHVSLRAVAAASRACSAEALLALERSILTLEDSWEAQNPRHRGRAQLALLQAMDSSRLSETGRARLGELERKFPGELLQAPLVSEVTTIGSPVPQEAFDKMSDEQWLGAMRKYAGIQFTRSVDTRRSGGESELAHALGNEAQKNAVRFVQLALKMPDELSWTYFDSLARGVADAARHESSGSPRLDQAMTLLRRLHMLPNRPCGRSIAWLIQKCDGCDWPAEIGEIVSWYAMNDPDPENEDWRTPSSNGTPYHGGDPYSAGINSTRGAIANVIGRLLFDHPDRYSQLSEAIQHLARDRSIAVRSCAMTSLSAVLNVDSRAAITLFIECVSIDPVLLAVPHVDRFIRQAGYANYGAIRPVIQEMLRSLNEETVGLAARQVCVLAFDVAEAENDAAAARIGTQAMRQAAADVYSTNVAHEVVGGVCREQLKQFFGDSDSKVAREAASAFQYIDKLSKADQAELLSAFLAAKPNKEALEPVIRALEDSSVKLPDLVCTLAEICVQAFKTEAGDISTAEAALGFDLSKLVIRLYAQTEDPIIQVRCLNLIDEMERHHFMGLSDELQRADR